jgi:hypothetical protein
MNCVAKSRLKTVILFSVQSSKFKVQSSKFKVQSSKFKVQSFNASTAYLVQIGPRAKADATLRRHGTAPPRGSINQSEIRDNPVGTSSP